jgi:hypothetical protein
MSEVTSVNGMTGAVVLTAADVEAVATSAEGQPGGVATLDGSGVLEGAQLPSSVETVSVVPSGGDDTSILQMAANTYAEVRLQRGATYKLTSNTGLVIDPSKCRFKGSGTTIGCGSMTAGTAVTFKGTTNSYGDASSGGWEGITLSGPGISSAVKGIAFAGESAAEATALFSAHDSTVHDFLVGVSEESNAYAINVYGLSVYNCGKVIDSSLASANAGERMTYIGCTFFNSTLALNLQNVEGSHHFVSCSFDFNVQLIALKGPHKCYMHGCHIEYSASTTIPVQLTGSAPILAVTDSEWYVHSQTVLTKELEAAIAVTKLEVLRVEAAITSGDTIKVVTSTSVDIFTASANAAVGATSISVTSHAPTFAHPATTSRVIDSTILPSVMVSNSAAIENNTGVYFTRVPMEGCITTTGNFIEGGTQSQVCFVFPNMADGTCINPGTGAALNMPSSFPARSSVMGPLYSNASAEAVSGNHTIKAEIRSLEVMSVTTKSNFTVSMGSGPPATQTQDLTVIVHNESGGMLGTITWPGSWAFAGWTWTNPAEGKRRAIRLTYDPNFNKWTVMSISPADY